MSAFSTVLRSQSMLARVFSSRQQCLHTSLCQFLPKAVPYILTDIGEGIVEVVVKEWYVKQGDKISQFDPVCEVQSDKASVTITSRFDGEIGKLHYGVDDMVKVGSSLLDILIADDAAADIPEIKSPASVPEPATPGTEPDDKYFSNKALATPAVRKIARESNVNLKTVQATEKAGRILREDIRSFLQETSQDSTIVNSSTVKAESTSLGQDYVEPIAGIKKAMVKSMNQAWKVPHFTYSDEVDVSALVAHKPQLERLEKSEGVKITFLPIFLKATSLALLKFPKLNAEVDESCEHLRVHSSHNLGVAMDTPSGLVVANIKNVQTLGVVGIARELKRLQEQGKVGRPGSADLSGGTLTLSNIGAIGGSPVSPILQSPQVVIGGLGRIQKLPRFNSTGQVIAQDILHVSWSADHRVVDGATVARFSNLFKLYISAPKLVLNL